MTNLLEIVYEYQLLHHKERSLDVPLDESERARQLGLGRLLKGEYMGSGSRSEVRRSTAPLPAQFTVPGGFGSGEIRNLSAHGAAIVTARPPKRGTRTILRVADPTAGFEYVFPATVVWSGHGIIGVVFDGTPNRTPFLAPSPDSWRGMRLGPSRSNPLVA